MKQIKKLTRPKASADLLFSLLCPFETANVVDFFVNKRVILKIQVKWSLRTRETLDIFNIILIFWSFDNNLCYFVHFAYKTCYCVIGICGKISYDSFFTLQYIVILNIPIFLQILT